MEARLREAELTALTEPRTISHVPLPISVYLQGKAGDSIGPLPTQWLELLFHTGVIDHRTPISLNGQRWRAIGDWSEMVDRLREVEREVERGQNPWPIVLPRDPTGPLPPSASSSVDLPRAPSSPAASGPSRPLTADLPPSTPDLATGDLGRRVGLTTRGTGDIPSRTPDIPPSQTTGTIDLHAIPARTFDGPPLSAWLRLAALRATGPFSVERSEGRIEVALRGGKVATVHTEDPELSLAKHLERKGVASRSQIQVAAGQASSFGGDFGAALIATGVVPPDQYFSTVVDWALTVLAALALEPPQKIDFRPAPVPSPAVPLGLDRMGALMQAVRTLSRQTLEPRLAPHGPRPLIVSQIEGLQLEDLGLRPVELRTLNSINGARTVAEVLAEAGSDEARKRAVLQVLFLSTESGFVVMGEDPLLKGELAEAAELQKELERLEGLDHFDVLGVGRTTNDEAVRAKYTELAKRYHPDKLRPEAAAALRELRQKMFGLVSDAFSALETEGRRKRYIESKTDKASDHELVKAQNAVLAETCFKKAEVFMRVRKYDEAIEQIDQALDLNSDEPEFRVYRKYLGYLATTRGEVDAELAEQTIDEIKDAIRTQPNLLSAHLFTAQLYKALGNNKLMARNYKKVLEIDPNHAEAAQELRLEQLRREKDKQKKKSWFG